MRYKVALIARNPARMVTTHLSANSVEQLAHLIASLYPGAEIVSCSELGPRR